MTAAGTSGRIKAPWRRSRFQRLEADFEVSVCVFVCVYVCASGVVCARVREWRGYCTYCLELNGFCDAVGALCVTGVIVAVVNIAGNIINIAGNIINRIIFT